MCIYCLDAAAPATRQAHVIPQGFCRNDIVLELGVECDSCNERNGRLDHALILHNRIWPSIMLRRIPGKKGPRQELGHLRVDPVTGDLNVRVRADQASFAETGMEVQLDDPRGFDESRFRRGLHHIALNYVALKKGTNEALLATYNPTRNYVRYGTGQTRHYVQVMYPDDTIRTELGVRFVPDAPGLVIKFMSFLDDFYVDVSESSQLHAWASTHLPEGTGLL